MKLAKRAKHATAFFAVLACFLLVGALIFAFPKVTAGLAIGGCIVMLMLVSWEIAADIVKGR